MFTLGSHSINLLLLLIGSAFIVGLHGYWHARHFAEGLSPRLDALISMGGFLAMVGAFVLGGRVGAYFGYPYAARVLALAAVWILYRAIRASIGIGRYGVRPRQISRN